MCGRFGLGNPERLDLLMRRLSFPAILGGAPRFNITPSADIPIVLSLDGEPATWIAKWGLVPGWAKDPAVGNKLAMARGESAREKPSFREAIKRRRALMPADLFYEWQPVEGQKGTLPWCVRKQDEQPFFMAALWEQWTPADKTGAAPLLTCCVITTDANESLRPIQDRMPLLIDEVDIARWLDPATSPDDIQAFMRPRLTDDLYSYRVSNWVNSPSHDDPRCIAPLGSVEEEPLRTGDKTKASRKEKRTDQLDAFL
ncbi:MAG: SOS response-associated peptidase [Phycisphaerae bacterium]|nr:SOS response-associated peptidase [Gemmatimonadaceae bacterium]